MVVKYTKWSLNVPTFSIARPSKIYQNWDFWIVNKPSGNPAQPLGTIFCPLPADNKTYYAIYKLATYDENFLVRHFLFYCTFLESHYLFYCIFL
jgi:hypothetical protein